MVAREHMEEDEETCLFHVMGLALDLIKDEHKVLQSSS